jgi:hypothetical protein
MSMRVRVFFLLLAVRGVLCLINLTPREFGAREGNIVKLSDSVTVSAQLAELRQELLELRQYTEKRFAEKDHPDGAPSRGGSKPHLQSPLIAKAIAREHDTCGKYQMDAKSKRYVVYSHCRPGQEGQGGCEPIGGLGDTLAGITTAAVAAYATGRTLLLDPDPDFHSAFDYDDAFDVAEVASMLQDGDRMPYVRLYNAMQPSAKFEKALLDQDTPVFVRTNRAFLCQMVNTTATTVDGIRIQKMLEARIGKPLKDVDCFEFAGCLLRKALRVKEDTWDALYAHMVSAGTDSKETQLAVQIRTGVVGRRRLIGGELQYDWAKDFDNNANIDTSQNPLRFDAFRNMLHNRAERLSFTDGPKCVMSLAASLLEAGKSPVVYVASDSSTLVNLVTDKLKEHNLDYDFNSAPKCHVGVDVTDSDCFVSEILEWLQLVISQQLIAQSPGAGQVLDSAYPRYAAIYSLNPQILVLDHSCKQSTSEYQGSHEQGNWVCRG